MRVCRGIQKTNWLRNVGKQERLSNVYSFIISKIELYNFNCLVRRLLQNSMSLPQTHINFIFEISTINTRVHGDAINDKELENIILWDILSYKGMFFFLQSYYFDQDKLYLPGFSKFFKKMAEKRHEDAQIVRLYRLWELSEFLFYH